LIVGSDCDVKTLVGQEFAKQIVMFDNVEKFSTIKH
jgi:hypothetical protein